MIAEETYPLTFFGRLLPGRIYALFAERHRFSERSGVSIGETPLTMYE